ncbi:MAG: hypothetical protein A2288_03725 [Candidatus Moranbacteria bacterium RIFOXYA12_FULL_44_15]|nr:MAG: hypothetical protein A2288_03725 [Candidatus Moranbacteria bacterium RIFOXYA12_FULL_44_15]
MLNIIFSLIIASFLPAFMLPDFLGGAASNISLKKNEARHQVLGEESQKSKENSQNCNLFPIDSAAAAEFVPARKSDFYDLKIWAGSSVAIDAASGTILHYDNGRKRTQIASLTKMMTAVLAVENIKDLDEEIIITAEALNVPGTVVGCPTSVFCNANRMYRGEKVRAEDLLKAMLMNSANDAASAIGIHIAGTQERFVGMMNEKAKELGLKDTNFCTPSGLEIDGAEDQCYSTAYDIARIASYSLRHDLIWDIMKIPEGKFYSTDEKYMHELKNTDILIEEIPNCLGGKTGFTPLAGKSLLLGSADASGRHRIIAVLLNDEQRWQDMRTMVDWIFENYEWR